MKGIFFFFFKQKTAYELKECDWSSDVCSSDLKKDKKKNVISHKKIRYFDKINMDEFKICKFNYHFCFNPYLFRSEFVKVFSKEPLNLKKEKNELILQKRYQKNIGLIGAKIMNKFPFRSEERRVGKACRSRRSP